MMRRWVKLRRARSDPDRSRARPAQVGRRRGAGGIRMNRVSCLLVAALIVVAVAIWASPELSWPDYLHRAAAVLVGTAAMVMLALITMPKAFFR